jgi:hypothetical protein
MLQKTFFTTLILFFVFSNLAFSQINQKDIVLEDLVEEISSNSDLDVDYSTIYDDLQYYYNNPLNLNTATYAQLEKLHFLNDLQIQSILDYRKKNGGFKTPYELQLLEGFDKEDIWRLLAFTTISGNTKQIRKINYSKIFEYGRHEIYLRTQRYIEPMKGYNIPDSIIKQNPNKSRYLGDPFKYYLRYKFHYGDRVQWGITAEKDPGEQFFQGAQKYGFDFYSAHLQIDKPINNFNYLSRIVIGDFQAQFGQGLTLWTGLTFGKSAYVLNVKKKPRSIRKYSSTDENQFLRGIGTIFKFGNFTLTTFGSYHKIDANISLTDSIDQSDIRQISSIQNTGYHRTPSEIIDRHSIGELVFGSDLSFSNSFIKTGLTFVNYSFSADLNKDIKPYQYYEFQGKSNFDLGLNYEFDIHKMRFFGESSISKNGGMATIDGVLVPLEHRVSMAVLYRNYSPMYQAYFSGALAEGSEDNNEKGLYFGLEIYPIPKFKISSYIDTYTFPWLKYRITSPLASGIEYFTQIDYSPSRYVTMYTRFKHEIKPQNINGQFIDYPVNVTRWNFRYHISFQISHNLTLKDRIEFSYYKKQKIERGFMAYQDISYRPNNLPLTINFRYAVFDAPYDARIYAYESDVLYAFSVPAYFYRGFRTYITAKYDFNKHFSMWLKLDQFNYFDRNILSEGSLNEIDGHTKTEAKIQIRYQF